MSELSVRQYLHNDGSGLTLGYDKSEADKVIAGLKARTAELEALNHDLCERVTENDEIRLHWEEIEQTRAENERMKARIAELEEERRWRKCSDEMPEEDKDVLFSDGNYIYLGCWTTWDGGCSEYSYETFSGWVESGSEDDYDFNEIKYWMPLPSAPKEEKMIEHGKLNGYLVAIKEELRKAEGKHPDFCDKMTNCVSADFMKKSELLYKKFNSKPPYSAESILEEEVREALSAYLEGDRIHALEELAQCGAVIIRMMDFVSKEIEDENADKV